MTEDFVVYEIRNSNLYRDLVLFHSGDLPPQSRLVCIIHKEPVQHDKPPPRPIRYLVAVPQLMTQANLGRTAVKDWRRIARVAGWLSADYQTLTAPAATIEELSKCTAHRVCRTWQQNLKDHIGERIVVCGDCHQRATDWALTARMSSSAISVSC